MIGLKLDSSQGAAQVIIYNGKDDMLEGGTDHRAPDGAAVGVPGRVPGADNPTKVKINEPSPQMIANDQ